jgi:GntR family transcriptional regulator
MIQSFANKRLSRAARQADKGGFLSDASTNGFTPSVAVSVSAKPADARTAGLLGINEGDGPRP